MYIVKNFLSDMANSTGGGERASKIMGFRRKKNFGYIFRFSVNGDLKGKSDKSLCHTFDHFQLSSVSEISTRCS